MDCDFPSDDCPDCGGTGYDEKGPCEGCGGTGQAGYRTRYRDEAPRDDDDWLRDGIGMPPGHGGYGRRG